MPIFAITLRTPPSTARRKLRCASSGVGTAELVRGSEVGDRLEREARADGVGAVADQAREVVHLARLVARDDERRRGAKPRLDEGAMDSGDREERGERKTLLGGRRIVEQQAGRAVAHSRDGIGGQPAASGLEGLVAERRVENLRVEQGKCRRVEEEAVELEELRAVGALVEQRRPRARGASAATSRSLPQVVDRRVRHLREALAEERVERPRAPGERRQRACRRPSTRSARGRARRRAAGRASGPRACSRPATWRARRSPAGGSTGSPAASCAPPDREPAQIRAAAASLRLTSSSSSTPRPAASTASISPGPSLPRRTRASCGSGIAPASDAHATRPSSVIA